MRLAGSQPAALKGVVTAAAAVRVGLGLGDEVSREEKGGFLDRDSRRHARSSPTSSCVLQGHVSPSFAWNSLCVHAVVRVRTCACAEHTPVYLYEGARMQFIGKCVCVLCTCYVYLLHSPRLRTSTYL